LPGMFSAPAFCRLGWRNGVAISIAPRHALRELNS
jgi:hypothetical protein